MAQAVRDLYRTGEEREVESGEWRVESEERGVKVMGEELRTACVRLVGCRDMPSPPTGKQLRRYSREAYVKMKIASFSIKSHVPYP